jgi:hypothetical protein
VFVELGLLLAHYRSSLEYAVVVAVCMLWQQLQVHVLCILHVFVCGLGIVQLASTCRWWLCISAVFDALGADCSAAIMLCGGSPMRC